MTFALSLLACPSLADARAKIRSHIDAMSEQARAWTPALISSTRFDSKVASTISTVGGFAGTSRFHEPSTLPVIEETNVAYPRVHEQEIRFHAALPTEAHPKLGILEPPASAPEVKPELLWVPCLLVDHAFRRIGRGGGYYDRYLKSNPQVWAFGVVFDDYVVPKLPATWLHPGDAELDGYITSQGFFISERRRIAS